MKIPFEILRNKLRDNLVHLVIFLMLAFMVVGYMSHRIFHTILPGEAGVHWSRFKGGTRVDYVYPEGMSVIPPWDKLYIYNVRIQEMSPELDVLTKSGLEVHLYLSIRYAPKYKLLGLLHRQVGPDYANKVIFPEIAAVLREVIGTMDAEQIYTTGRTVIVEAINLAIERVAQRYINVDGVLIKKIELPAKVAESIRYKAEQEQLVQAHHFIVEKEKQEAERKRIEGQGIRDQMNIIASSVPNGDILKWMGINATLELSKSNNTKVVVIGAGATKEGFQIFGDVSLESASQNIPPGKVANIPAKSSEPNKAPGR
jgi:regulator of protease activity HflC (stomatin/prohibitin superfamily)